MNLRNSYLTAVWSLCSAMTSRRDRRRALNDALARADQENPGRLDRWDRPWTGEELDRLDRLLRDCDCEGCRTGEGCWWPR